MKKAATILFILGAVAFVAAVPFKGELKTGNAIGLILGSILTALAFFMRSRSKAGLGLFTITEKDKTELKKLRTEFAPRNFLGQLLGKFAGLFIIVGILSPLYSDSSFKAKWSIAVSMVAFGLFLGFCAALLVNPASTHDRPPFWLPAVSGLVCSFFVIVMAGCACIIAFASKGDYSAGFRYVLSFSVIGSVLAAVVCLATGIPAILKARRLNRNRLNQPLP
jgi:hypothetical protein